MEVLCLVLGGSGDCRPLVALAVELRKRNHQITFCSDKDAETFIAQNGFENIVADFSFIKKMIEIDTVKKHQRIKTMERVCSEMMNNFFQKTLNIASRFDLIIGGTITLLGNTIAEFTGIPYLSIIHTPNFIRTDFLPPVNVPNISLPKWNNRLLHSLAEKVYTKTFYHSVQIKRKELHLEPMSFRETCCKNVLYSMNETLAPLPPDADYARFRTGYLHYFDGKELDPNVQEFLKRTEKTIYIGFGSIPFTHQEDLKTALAELLQKTDWNILLYKCLDEEDPFLKNVRIMSVKNQPHKKLFPQVAAVAHHGGAGTTSTSLYCGVPQVVVPHVLDQFYFAHRIETLKLGPPAVKPTRLKTHLADALIKAVTTDKYKSNAQRIAKEEQSVNSASAAADFIEKNYT